MQLARGSGASSVSLVREERFLRSSDGTIWSRWGTGRHTWAPYLEVFDEVVLVARVQDVAEPPKGATVVSADRVRLCPITYFQGPAQYLRCFRTVQRDLSRWLAKSGPLIVRMPSPLGNAIQSSLAGRRRPFAVEIAGDPYDQMSPGAMRHPLRPFFRWYYTDLQKKAARQAQVVKYVTRDFLQRRYPAAGSAAVHAVSDVFLPPEAFCTRKRPSPRDPIRLVFVGMLEQLYKGPDLLLEAVATARRSGARLALTIIGDGQFRPRLEHMASALGIAQESRFLGACDRQQIERTLDDSDIFILPSRQEGLPRAMLEAMARSLPCIGTDVGGIPELLESDFVVPPNHVDALTAKLLTLASDPQRLLRAGERNLATARQYRLAVRYEHEIAFASDVQRLCC